MKNSKASVILVLGVSAVCLTLALAARNSSGSRQEAGTHPAIRQDLVSKSGEKILEVVEASYRTTVEGLEGSSLMVRNLSGKNITALGILWTVTFSDEKGEELQQLVDYKVHPDLVKAKGVRPFAPYEEKFIPRLTKGVVGEGRIIKSVKVEISFAEFEDSTGVGLETSEMYKQLIAQRGGAEIYKRWVEAAYAGDPRNMRAVVARLSGGELPGDKELQNGAVEQGALIYRRWLRDILKDKGENALQEQLHGQLRGRR